MEPERVPGFAHSIDLFPTIAAAAGLEAPGDLPGINLLDRQAVRGRKAVFGVCHASHNITIGDPDDTLQYLWCVEGDWKLMVRHHGRDTSHYRTLHAWDTAPVRLYNLKDDPREEKDLAVSRPGIVEGLRQKIERWHPVNCPEPCSQKTEGPARPAGAGDRRNTQNTPD